MLKFLAMNRRNIEGLLREFFARDPHGAAAVYLFGSQARATAGPRSDVDVAILFNQPPPHTLEGMHFDLAADLEDLLGLPVDLMILNRANVDLVHRVLRDGRLVLDRNRSRRIAFEVRARNEYFDLQPILERYRKAQVRP